MSIRVAFASDVSYITTPDRITYSAIGFGVGASWKPIRFEPETASLKIEEVETDHGLHYPSTITFIRKKDEAEAWTWLRKHRNRGLVVETVDLYGTVRLIGSRSHPVYMRFGYDGKAEFGEMQEFSIRLIGKHLDPPLVGGPSVITVTPGNGGGSSTSTEMTWTERIRVQYDGQAYIQFAETGEILSVSFKGITLDPGSSSESGGEFTTTATPTNKVVPGFTYTGLDYPRANDVFVVILRKNLT